MQKDNFQQNLAAFLVAKDSENKIIQKLCRKGTKIFSDMSLLVQEATFEVKAALYPFNFGPKT